MRFELEDVILIIETKYEIHLCINNIHWWALTKELGCKHKKTWLKCLNKYRQAYAYPFICFVQSLGSCLMQFSACCYELNIRLPSLLFLFSLRTLLHKCSNTFAKASQSTTDEDISYMFHIMFDPFNFQIKLLT